MSVTAGAVPAVKHRGISDDKRFGGTRRLNEFSEFYKAQVTEMQRMNALLDRIAVAPEKRALGPP